jgi:AraC family ethanolamine operon transcriptional activator
MDIADLAASDPGRLGNPAVARAIVEAIATSLGAALGNPPERPGRAGRRCLRIVAAATEYLDAILGRPVYSDEVAEALGVSPRSLNEAFGAVLGMSLHRYLQTRRLNLAHRRLRAGEDGLVKTVALDLGFWHLGRFAISYRALFGETPAETLLQGRLRPR